MIKFSLQAGHSKRLKTVTKKETENYSSIL